MERLIALLVHLVGRAPPPEELFGQGCVTVLSHGHQGGQSGVVRAVHIGTPREEVGGSISVAKDTGVQEGSIAIHVVEVHIDRGHREVEEKRGSGLAGGVMKSSLLVLVGQVCIGTLLHEVFDQGDRARDDGEVERCIAVYVAEVDAKVGRSRVSPSLNKKPAAGKISC